MKPLPYNIKQTNIDFDKLLGEKRGEFSIIFARNLSLQEQTLQVFRISIEHCDFNKFPKSKVVWNAAGYINIVSFDLKIIAKNLAFAELEWEKRYFARQAALLIHEGVEDLFELFGKSLRVIIEELPNGEILKMELKGLTKRLNEYRSLYGAKLNELRNFSIAHRDKDVLAQLNVICLISWTDAITYASAFDAILNDAGRFMQQLLSKGYFDT